MITPEEEVLLSLVRNWRKNHSDQRFGQWLWNVCSGHLFYTEDDEMADLMVDQLSREVDGEPQDPPDDADLP